MRAGYIRYHHYQRNNKKITDMAILSNGKFYGFLCSVKETGRKLANGVKEYVEDFVSGFAGHGWKLWEYMTGKWKLEIDTVVVRETMLVFEMLISKVRAIIGAQTISQGHGKVKSVRLSDDGTEYLIELEDEEISIVAHDFVRCQTFTGGKVKLYHVEVDSVDTETRTLHVPMSEFDRDESGNVLYPPESGDELVQFGNSQDKARQSAIYLHADETGQPAIDVMFDIDSKNWNGKVKVRVGGDIPDSGGLKGFYCENGMIKGADSSGHTVYCIYPDGTAEFGDGSARFATDKSGHIAGGAISWVWNAEKKKYVCTMKDIVLTWDSLSDEAKENLKGEPGKDANLLPWIEKWNGYATELGEEYIVTPKMFSGTKTVDSDGNVLLTGIAQGKDCLTDKTTGEKRTGIFALVDNEIVFELDPISKKYKFAGEIEADAGRIGGFDINQYGLVNADGKDCYVKMTRKDVVGYENDGTEKYVTRTATLGNGLPAVIGIDEIARMSYTGASDGEHRVLTLIATGSSLHTEVFGGYANLCINAIGGCNWKMNPGDHWCMPGVLGIIRLTYTYNADKNHFSGTYSTMWGNGIPPFYELSLSGADIGTRTIVVKMDMGHSDYSVIGQAIGPSVGKEDDIHWGLTAHVEYRNDTGFGISVWSGNIKRIPSILDMFILGRPYTSSN